MILGMAICGVRVVRVSAGLSGAADGGYMFPASFVNMVERQQCWNLPDPFDATPVKQDIRVYYTDLNVGALVLLF